MDIGIYSGETLNGQFIEPLANQVMNQVLQDFHRMAVTYKSSFRLRYWYISLQPIPSGSLG